MDKKKATKIQNINDGISAGSGIVALAVPEFSRWLQTKGKLLNGSV